MSHVCSMFNRSGIHRPSYQLATEIRHKCLPKSQWNRHDDLITVQTITKRSAIVRMQCKSDQLLDVTGIVFLRFGSKTVPCYARPFAAIGIRSRILRTCGHNSRRAGLSACNTPLFRRGAAAADASVDVEAMEECIVWALKGFFIAETSVEL